MESCTQVGLLSEALTPLTTTFGDRLNLQRHGDLACWTFEGQSVMVELHPSGSIAAKYFDRPAVDAVSARPAGGMYESSGREYLATPAGCSRMVADMLAFFSGTREPRFTFADAYVLDA